MLSANAVDVGTITRSPAVPTLDGMYLPWLLDQYIAATYARLGRRHTVVGYRGKLNWFVRWWEVAGPSCAWRLCQHDLEGFERYLREVKSPLSHKSLSYHTRNDVFRRLRRALKWAYENGYVQRDYGDWLPKADGAPPKRKAVSVQRLEQLLLAGATSGNPRRDQAMLAMMMGMGLRRAEIRNLDVGCLVFGEDLSGYADVVGKITAANASGERQAAFDAATGKYIIAHLQATGYASGPLFRNKFGARISCTGINVIVSKAIRRAGLEGEVKGCHDLRRAFATHYRRQHGDKDMLRRQLGHAKYETTDLLYTLLDVEDLRLSLVSPLASMTRV